MLATLIPLFLFKVSSRQEVISLRQTNLYDSNFHMNCKIKEDALCLKSIKWIKMSITSVRSRCLSKAWALGRAEASGDCKRILVFLPCEYGTASLKSEWSLLWVDFSSKVNAFRCSLPKKKKNFVYSVMSQSYGEP